MTPRANAVVPLSLPPLVWIAGLAAGLLAGVAVAVPPVALAVGLGVAAAVAFFVRSAVRTEAVVAAYWIAFCVFSTMLADQVVGGMFYPFYGALVAGAVWGLVTGGLRVRPVIAWTYVGLLVVLVVSLIGFEGSIGSETLERLIVFPFGALVLLQIRSRRGLRVVAAGAVLASLSVSVWVIVSAVLGDFAYRGNVDANENVVSFYVALGFVVALTERVHGDTGPRRGAVTALAVLAMATMAYALVLLASRGMIIGLALAALAVGARVLWMEPRRVPFVAVLLAVAASGLLLPGGQGILQRFEDPSTATGGGRLQIWARIGESLAASGPAELAVGHGFGASSELVARSFTSLNSTHNAYLLVVYDFGIVGMLLFLALHAVVLARSWRVSGRDGAAMLALVTFLLGSNLFMSTPDDFLYWTALGFALAMATLSGGARRRETP